MHRSLKYVVLGLVVSGFLASAGAALAAPKLECAVMKDGKTTKHMVDNAAACKRMGGTLVKTNAVDKKKDRAE